jgi:hypothetical protein
VQPAATPRAATKAVAAPARKAVRRSAGGSWVEAQVELADGGSGDLVVKVSDGKTLTKTTLAGFIGEPVKGAGGLFRPTFAMSTETDTRAAQVQRLERVLVDFLKAYAGAVPLVAHCESCNNNNNNNGKGGGKGRKR